MRVISNKRADFVKSGCAVGVLSGYFVLRSLQSLVSCRKLDRRRLYRSNTPLRARCRRRGYRNLRRARRRQTKSLRARPSSSSCASGRRRFGWMAAPRRSTSARRRRRTWQGASATMGSRAGGGRSAGGRHSAAGTSAAWRRSACWESPLKRAGGRRGRRRGKAAR